MDTETTVKSLFCSQWAWPLEAGFWIEFKPEGTGKLVCAIELATLIAAEIDWKPVGGCSTILERKLDMNTDFQVSLDVEISLTKRYVPDISPEQFIEETLLDAAFRPKTYKVELAKGSFAKADWLWWEGKRPPMHSDFWFGLRMVFDKSPYPPLEEWIKDRASLRAVEGNEICGLRDFYRDTEESRYRKPDEKVMAERRRKALEKLRRPSHLHDREGASGSS